jgi:hypothetical protein
VSDLLSRIRLTWLRLCLVAEKSDENLEVIREMKGLSVSVYPRFDWRESGGKDKCYLGILVFDVSGSERWKFCY